MEEPMVESADDVGETCDVIVDEQHSEVANIAATPFEVGSDRRVDAPSPVDSGLRLNVQSGSYDALVLENRRRRCSASSNLVHCHDTLSSSRRDFSVTFRRWSVLPDLLGRRRCRRPHRPLPLPRLRRPDAHALPADVAARAAVVGAGRSGRRHLRNLQRPLPRPHRLQAGGQEDRQQARRFQGRRRSYVNFYLGDGTASSSSGNIEGMSK